LSHAASPESQQALWRRSESGATLQGNMLNYIVGMPDESYRLTSSSTDSGWKGGPFTSWILATGKQHA
jgi:hypothetical protein